MRSAVEWAQVRAMAADGVSQREIAIRLGINRRTVRRLIDAGEPPRYRRAPSGSMLDPLEPVIGRLIEAWPQIKAPRVTEVLRDDYGYAGSVDLVRKLEGHVRAFGWLGGVPRECVYDNLRSAVARRERDGERDVITWNAGAVVAAELAGVAAGGALGVVCA